MVLVMKAKHIGLSSVYLLVSVHRVRYRVFSDYVSLELRYNQYDYKSGSANPNGRLKI